MMKTVDEIKSMPIWMLWKKRSRGTQMSKIPIAADGRSCGTSENYADRWVTFDDAQQAATERKADGIGFRIPNGMFFLDIDHRDLQDPFVQEIMALYKSYSEFSVSGQGIHIYGLCDISAADLYRFQRRQEKAFQGILYAPLGYKKCVKALQTVISNGYKFSEPASVITAREQYQATNSTVISFFEECMCH